MLSLFIILRILCFEDSLKIHKDLAAENLADGSLGDKNWPDVTNIYLLLQWQE